MRMFSRTFRLLVMLGSLTLAAMTSTRAAETDPAILSTVDAAIAAINAGSVADTQAVFLESPTAITDDFPPFSWSGKKAVADYTHDFKSIIAKDGITDWRFQRDTPRSLYATETRAIAVVPTSNPFMLGGKTQSRAGDWLFILAKTDGKWKVDVMSFVDSHHTMLP